MIYTICYSVSNFFKSTPINDERYCPTRTMDKSLHYDYRAKGFLLPAYTFRYSLYTKMIAINEDLMGMTGGIHH